MPWEPEIGLVGRDELVALVEQLIERRPKRPLPIVVAFGPGGSGKTEFLRHLRARHWQAAPLAYVDLDRAGSGVVEAILNVAHGWLHGYENKNFGRLHLPRYTLAKAVLSADLQDRRDLRRQARDLIANQLRGLALFADSASDAAEASAPPATPGARLVARLLQPFLRWLVVMAVIMPTGLRRLYGANGAALAWFEEVAGPSVLEVPAQRIDGVITGLWAIREGRDRPSRRTVDKLLVRAFLADLKAAYKGQRHRRVNTLLLLDDADLLPGAESRNPVGDDGPADILELLAEAHREDPDIPLLVVAAKQATASRSQPETTSGHDDPMAAAAARYQAWRTRYEEDNDHESVLLTARLEPFASPQTRQVLSLWNTKLGKTVETHALVEQLQEVTHGHPLAIKALYRRDRGGAASLRRIFTEDLEWNDSTRQWGQTFGGYLLWRFLNRLEGIEPLDTASAGLEPADRGIANRNLLARLAAPRRLDVGVIQTVTGLDELDARRMLERLATFSFAGSADPDGDGRPHDGGVTSLRMHPLLRDLLAPVLIDLQEPDGDPAYLTIHARLRDYFRGQPGCETEYLYHCLALGDTHEVAERIRPLLSRPGSSWMPVLLAVTEAPTPERELARWRRWLQERFGRHVLDRIARPELRRVEVLVEALWSLHSCTGTSPRTPRAYSEVMNAFQALIDHGEILADDPAVDATVGVYERRRQALIDEKPAAGVDDPPAYCAPGLARPYPKVWPPRHFIRNTGLTVTASALLFYGMVYGYHQVRQCNTPDPLDVVTVVGETLGSKPRLQDIEGQCVGITERPGYFTTDKQELRTGEREVEKLATLIDEQNKGVLEYVENNPEFSYVTVVVATMLSSNEEARRDLSAGVNELRGTYLAQRQWNRLDTNTDKPNVMLRVVLANFGGNSEHADDVARQIRELAEQDPTVVAVTGMGQTRESTVIAAKVLGGDEHLDPNMDGIPMVGSALSGNEFTGLPYFVRTAPSNRREVEAIQRFIDSRPDMRDRTPYLVVDEGDPYSRDLADDFAVSFAESEALSANRGNGQDPGYARTTYNSSSSATVESMDGLVDQICAEEPTPLIVYTGRTNEVSTLIKSLHGSTCGAEAVVVGPDDLSQLETGGFSELESEESFTSGRLFYATFGADEEGWRQVAASRETGSNDPPERVQIFFDAYDTMARRYGDPNEGNPAFRSGSNGHIMLAYDAVNLVMERVKPAGAELSYDRDVVFRRLRSPEEPYRGVSGSIQFEPTGGVPGRGSDPQDKLIIFQSVVLRDGRLEAEFVAHDGTP